MFEALGSLLGGGGGGEGGGGGGPMDLVGGLPRMVGIEPSGLPIVGGMFTNPAEEAQKRQFGEIARVLQQYRQMIPGARRRALSSSLGAFTPANRMLGSMYGPQAMVDMSSIAQDPMAEVMSSTAPEGARAPGPSVFDGNRDVLPVSFADGLF